MSVKKTAIPLLIVFTVGLLAFVHDFIPHPLVGQFRERMTTGLIIIGGLAVFIGMYSLLHMHFSRIRRGQPGWGYSIFVFIGAVGMIVLGLYNGGYGPLAKSVKGDWFDWSYNNVQVPIQATIFSILAFFIASAAFRTFRARNFGAALLLTAAIIVMFGRVPVGEWVGKHLLGDSQFFPRVVDWIMEYPNMAAQRGIMLGISLGVIAQSLRVLFGIERSYMGGGDE